MASEAMRSTVASLLRGIDRYNPENLQTLEHYIDAQASENTYDLEANLAVLKLYQFNPIHFNPGVTVKILLKALTNLPHTDFILCKSLIDSSKQSRDESVAKVMHLADLLEKCQFDTFWNTLDANPGLCAGIAGFEDSIRKFVCHVVGITYQTIEKACLAELLGNITEPQVGQWIAKYGWRASDNGQVFIANQEENIKTKNITEKITFDSVSAIMASVYR